MHSKWCAIRQMSSRKANPRLRRVSNVQMIPEREISDRARSIKASDRWTYYDLACMTSSSSSHARLSNPPPTISLTGACDKPNFTGSAAQTRQHKLQLQKFSHISAVQSFVLVSWRPRFCYVTFIRLTSFQILKNNSCKRSEVEILTEGFGLFATS